MSTPARTHLAYVVTIAALLSLGATHTARTMLQVITSPADVTGTTPAVRFLDSTSGDTDWQIEAQGVATPAPNFLEFAVDGTTIGNGPFKIHRDSDPDQLTLDENGNVAINEEETSNGIEFEVFGNTGSNDTFAGIGIQPGFLVALARMTVDTSTESFSIAVRDTASGLLIEDAFTLDLRAPENSLVVSGDGVVGIGIDKANVDSSANLHIHDSSPEILLDATGVDGDWEIEALNGSNTAIIFAKEDTSENVVIFDNDAPANSLVIADLGNTGFGTAMPDAPVHVFRDDGTALFKVEEASGTTAISQMMNLVNNGGVRFSLENTANSRQWEFTNDSAGNFNISLVGTGGRELGISPTGQMIVGPGGNPSHVMQASGNLIIQGALTQGSDRDRKENFREVDCNEILAKVAELPVTSWNYKHDEDTVRHIGPVAQDFHQAFALGHDELSITSLDSDGVALASIKALNAKLEQKDAQIQELQKRLEAMEAVISRLDSTD